MGDGAKLIHRWFEEIWNQGRTDTINELLAPDAVVHGLAAGDIAGPKAFRAYHDTFRARFAHVRVTVERTLEQGTHVAAWCGVTAVHRGTNTPITFTGVVMGEVRDGMLHEGWNNWDFLGVLVQLGAITPETVQAHFGP